MTDEQIDQPTQAGKTSGSSAISGSFRSCIPKCVAVFEKNFRIPCDGAERFVEAMTQTDVRPCLSESVVRESLEAGKILVTKLMERKKP